MSIAVERGQRYLGSAGAGLPDPETTGRLLINKASTLEKLGRNEEALALLAETVPLAEASTDRRLPAVLRFNVIVNLCELGRYAEAEPLLAEVRQMAVGLGLKLDLRRLRWLEGRVAGGLGCTDEAIATLTAVKDEFADLGIAYDAALATLELAVLLLDHGRTAEVKRLAEQSKKIFDTQGVAREALATLQVFRRAVAREALTAALARRLIEDLRGALKVSGEKLDLKGTPSADAERGSRDAEVMSADAGPSPTTWSKTFSCSRTPRAPIPRRAIAGRPSLAGAGIVVNLFFTGLADALAGAPSSRSACPSTSPGARSGGGGRATGPPAGGRRASCCGRGPAPGSFPPR